MKVINRLFLVLSILIIPVWVCCQTLVIDGVAVSIEAGTNVYLDQFSFQNETNGSDGSINNDGNIFVEGNWTNNATGGGQVFTGTNGTGVVHFTHTALQTVGGTEETTFENVTVNNSGVGLQLGNSVTVLTTLTMTDGDVDLNGNNISLSTAGTMTGESNTNRVFGTSGEIIASSRDLSATSTLFSDIAGLGISITTGAGNTPGITTLERGHAEQTGDGNTSILRYFDITPTTNTALGATLNIEYYDNELNGQAETDFKFWRSTDGGTTWINEGGTVNTGSNFVEKTPTDQFSRWTISNEMTNPLPIELLSFAVKSYDDHVLVTWSTATEVNNDYFTVQRSRDADSFNDVTTITGAGFSNQILDYATRDDQPLPGQSYYRLKQTDFDGTFTYSEIAAAHFDGGELLTVYPNPVQEQSFNVEIQGGDSDEVLDIAFTNILGELILKQTVVLKANRVNNYLIKLNNPVQSGIYLLKVSSNNRVYDRKIKLD